MQFVGTPVFVTELPEGFAPEAARLLLNYLAALAGLRDAQRAVHRRLWPDRDDENRACETCGRSEPKRTKWEVEVWDPKREELLGDERIAFLTKLRDYSLHYATPEMAVSSHLQSMSDSGAGPPMQMRNAVGISRLELLKWDGWNARARGFINGHDGNTIDLMPLVAFFSQRVREFIQWFFEQIDNAVGRETREYVDKYNDLHLWGKVHEASAQYRVVRSNDHHRKRVEARLERASNRTRGWRVIAADVNGELVVGDSEWPPLSSDLC